MKKLITFLICLLLFIPIAKAQISGPTYWKKVGNNILLTNILWELGSAAQPFAKIWTSALESSGALTITTDNANALLVQTTGNFPILNVDTITRFVEADQLYVESNAKFDGGIQTFKQNAILMNNTAETDYTGFWFDPYQTNNSLAYFTDLTSRNILFYDGNDLTVDWGHPVSSDPKIYLQSSDETDSAENLSLTYDSATDTGIIDVGTGRLSLPDPVDMNEANVRSAVPTMNFIDTDTVDQDNNAQITVNATNTGSGAEDVDFTLSTQNNGTLKNFLMADGDGGALGNGTLKIGGVAATLDFLPWAESFAFFNTAMTEFYGFFIHSQDDGLQLLLSSQNDSGNNNLIIGSADYFGSSYGHTTKSPDPTVFFHSSTNPSVTINEWGSISHNGEDFIIDTNIGTVVFPNEMQTPVANIVDNIPTLYWVDTNTVAQNPGSDIIVNATNTGAGTEDFDIFWEAIINGGQRILYFLDGDGGTGTNGLLTIGDPAIEIITDNILTTAYTLLTTQGSDITSANDITIPLNGNYYDITGATQINRIASTGWVAGAGFKLQFDNSLIVKHNQTPGGGFASILITGSADYVSTAGSILDCIYDGTAFKCWPVFTP